MTILLLACLAASGCMSARTSVSPPQPTFTENWEAMRQSYLSAIAQTPPNQREAQQILRAYDDRVSASAARSRRARGIVTDEHGARLDGVRLLLTWTHIREPFATDEHQYSSIDTDGSFELNYSWWDSVRLYFHKDGYRSELVEFVDSTRFVPEQAASELKRGVLLPLDGVKGGVRITLRKEEPRPPAPAGR